MKHAAIALHLGLLLLAGAALAQEHTAHGTIVVHVTAVDYAFDAPDTLEAGFVDLTFTNAGKESHHLQVARLNDGVTQEQLVQALEQGPEAALPLVELVGGVGVIPPGQSQTVVTDLSRPGTYVELCFVENAEGVPHLALGMTRFFEVTAAAAPVERPDIQPDLVVHMMDFGFDLPAEVTAGEQVWEVVNDGPQPHELALMKLREGQTAEDVMAFLQGDTMGGEPPADEVGGVQAMSVGYSSFVTVELTPGEYIALCFVPDPASGQPHLALGMLDSFTVVE